MGVWLALKGVWLALKGLWLVNALIYVCLCSHNRSFVFYYIHEHLFVYFLNERTFTRNLIR